MIGQVLSQAQQMVAEAVARSVVGVTDVVNPLVMSCPRTEFAYEL